MWLVGNGYCDIGSLSLTTNPRLVGLTQWAYSTGQVPSHTFLLIGRF